MCRIGLRPGDLASSGWLNRLFMPMGNLLMWYIRLAVREAHLARVPNQLITAEPNEEDTDEGTDVNEFCGAGGGNAVGSGNVMGFSGPLGAGSSFPNRRKKKRTKKTS